MKLYFCQFAGAGTEHDPYRLTVYDYMTPEVASASGSYDLRRDATLGAGWCVVWASGISEAEHQAIIADPLCVYVPRDVLPANIPAALNDLTDLQSLSRALADRGVSVDGIGISTPTLAALLHAFPAME